jgi:hypothetical protein
MTIQERSIKKACPKKSRPLLTYEKHLFTKIGEILTFATITKRI